MGESFPDWRWFPGRVLGRYGQVLRVRGVPMLTLAGCFAQVTQGAAAVGFVLVIAEVTRSFGLAGATVGAFAIGAGGGRPVQGRLIDRRGPAGPLAALGLLHGLGIAAVVALAATDARPVTYLLAGAVAGFGLPAIAPSMRVLLGAVVAEERTASYSVVAVTQELAILFGPLLYGALVVLASARLALLAVAAVAVAGTFAFAMNSLTRRTQPAAAPHPGTVDRKVFTLAMVLILGLAALLGAAFGAAQVAAPAFAAEQGEPAASGLLLAAFSVGGIAGALAIGALRWHWPAASKVALLLALLAVGLAIVAAGRSLLTVGVLLLVAGLPFTPALTTMALLVDEHAPRAVLTEAFAWVSTATAVGLSAGSALAGVVAERSGPSSAFLQAGGAAGLGVLLALVAHRRLAAS